LTASASDAPQRAAGLRTRSGNAMLRTRAALLEAAATCVERQGVRRTTMSDVAATAGVAKATLYNHFRAKDDVLTALVDAQVAALAEQCVAVAAEKGLEAALDLAAAELGASPPLRRVASEEPALLVPLAVPGQGRRWEQVHQAVAGVLVAAGASSGPGQVELVQRWLLSQLLWPVDLASAGAQALAAGLTSGASTVPAQGRPSERAQPAGLGWPGEPATLRPR
jgi:AcrR family transcriptional regulator